MTWTCETFERWLDEGRVHDAGAEAHALACGPCARSLRAAIALDEALALPVAVAAPASFTDEVLRRARLARAFTPSPSLAWWVRVGAEPTVAGACALIALLLWRGQALWSYASVLPSRFGAWSDGAFQLLSTVAVLRVFTSPAVILGLTPLFFFASWWLFGWSERFIARRMVPAR